MTPIRLTAAAARTPAVLFVVVAAGVAHPALADVQFTSVHRAVTARALAGAEADGPFSAESFALGTFDESVQAAVTIDGAATGATASQLSEFLTDRIVAQGSANTSTTSLSGIIIDTAGASVFDIVFRVETQTSVELAAATSGTGTVSFGFENGPVLFDGPGAGAFTLDPGVAYRLSASAGGSLDAAGSEGGGFSLELIGVPTPGALAVFAGAGLLAARRRR